MIEYDSIEFDLLYCSVLYLISMNDLCVRVRVRVCVWGRRSWEQRVKKEKRKNKETGEKTKHKLIHTDKQTDKQTDERTDGQIDRHKSFIDMRYYTEQYSKSNSIKEYRIKSNWNKVE